MKVDAIRLDLRPRGMFEAADLGVRLVSAHRRSVWTSCTPVYVLVVAAASLALLLGAPWGVLVLICLKPWFDRSVLFVLARAAFGEDTRFADVWVHRRRVWWDGLVDTLTIRRLSPWRSYVQPVLQLEGLRGKARRQRAALILGSHRGAALAMQSAFACVEACVTLGAFVLASWLVPGDDQRQSMFLLLGEPGHPWLLAYLIACYVATVVVLEPFFVGAGFAMYLNRRVELEALDIEQEFRLAFAR